jgi:hypothetical protein
MTEKSEPFQLLYGQERRDAAAAIEDTSSYCKLNFVSILTRTATALPSFVPAVNVHCFKAFTACASRP